jgi:hypothetical protein
MRDLGDTDHEESGLYWDAFEMAKNAFSARK